MNLHEIESLLAIEDDEGLENLFDRAKRIKEENFGKTIRLFAPLYITNECVNNCLYCGFRVGNKVIRRRSLEIDEIIEEAKLLERMGHRHILLVASENSVYAGAERVACIVDELRGKTQMEKVGVNIAPLSKKDFKILAGSSLSYYQIFQETYHLETYRKMHPSKRKGDYGWRFRAMERALEAGIKEVGMGVLLGLYDYRFEVPKLIEHIRSLQERFGEAVCAISLPRLRPAVGTLLKESVYSVSDKELKKIAAVLRITFPRMNIVISTRESAELRDEMLAIGISEMSAGSRTSPGGYSNDGVEEQKAQFEIEDLRSVDEISGALASYGCEAVFV